MEYRTLGKTGLRVSEIGMGTWQLANDEDCWVGADLDESLNCLHRFVELGGNFIDTASSYGQFSGDPEHHGSEELIGRFLKESGKRDKVVIASKIAPKNWKWPARYGTPISEVFPDDYIERSVNDSLRSLGVETIDIMQFHVWNDEFVNDGGWQETVQKITKAGKVKYWGISNNNYQPTNGVKAMDTGLISTFQFIFNIFHQKPVEKLLPFAKRNNIGLIVRTPLDEGGLTGKFTAKTEFAEGDFRKIYFSKDRLIDLVKRTDRLRALLDDEAEGLVELDLRYLLSWPEVSTVIPGMNRLRYVEQNLLVSDGRKLSGSLMNKLVDHRWERNFYPSYNLDPALASTEYLEK